MAVSQHTSPDNNFVWVWDLPTRLFHWLLVSSVTLTFATGKLGGTWMVYHEYFGFMTGSLIVFRILWGLSGGHHARFSTFLKAPLSVLKYALTLLKKESPRHLGHNPLGGYSIIAMLLTLGIQIGCGWFANDDILTEGPLFSLVSKETSDFLTKIHHLNQNIILSLILVHIGAILFYLVFKKENLIIPMFTGKKRWHQPVSTPKGKYVIPFLTSGCIIATAYFLLYG